MSIPVVTQAIVSAAPVVSPAPVSGPTGSFALLSAPTVSAVVLNAPMVSSVAVAAPVSVPVAATPSSGGSVAFGGVVAMSQTQPEDLIALIRSGTIQLSRREHPVAKPHEQQVPAPSFSLPPPMLFDEDSGDLVAGDANVMDPGFAGLLLDDLGEEWSLISPLTTPFEQNYSPEA